MSTAFCRGCGQPVASSAPTCTHCGAPLSAGPAQRTTENTSAKWQRRFALIQKAGGPNLSALSKLSMSERVSVKFNVWAFFFGPFYYAFLGMWKRAVSLFIVELAIILIGDALLDALGVRLPLASFFAAGFVAGKANVDYFKKQVLNDNGWW
jgi:hypothetical protein